MGIAKIFIGKPIALLIKALTKNGTIMKLLPKFKSGLSSLSGLVGQFTKWAKEYTWFSKIWEPMAKTFSSGVTKFGKLVDDVIAKGSKAGQKALPSGSKAGQKALSSGSKAGISTLKGLTDDGAIALEKIMANGKYIKPEQLNKLMSSDLAPAVTTVINKFGTKRLETLEQALSTLYTNLSGRVGKTMVNNIKPVTSLLKNSKALVLPLSSKVAKQTSGLLVKSVKGNQMVKVMEISGKTVKEKLVNPTFLDKFKVFKIAGKYKIAASVLIANGLSNMIFGDDEKNYVVYDESLKSDVGTSDGGSAKSDGGIVTDHDKTWDYKKKGNDYYTKRKTSTNWIHVTPQMKGGKPLNAIKTKVYGETI